VVENLVFQNGYLLLDAKRTTQIYSRAVERKFFDDNNNFKEKLFGSHKNDKNFKIG
jgi:hypothetical protein